MTILDKREIVTPDLADALKQVEEYISNGWQINYELQDYPSLIGYTYVIVMVLIGDEEVVAEKATIVAPKATPAKPVVKKGA